MSNFSLILSVCLVFGIMQGLGQKSSSCPESNARYPVPGQCDAYIECKDGIPEEKLCPDGLLFNTNSSVFHYPCGYPIDVDCQNRGKTQPAQATDDCPHKFGYYKMGDESHCGQFMNCVEGRGFLFDCPEGLAFNPETYRCDWPDEAPDCDAEKYLGFTCPEVKTLDGIPQSDFQFYRGADCQRYFVCVAGKPRMYNCGDGNAFNDISMSCDARENVTGCNDLDTYDKPIQLNQRPNNQQQPYRRQ